MQHGVIIEIPCKYYIGVFLENNCGSPADISNFPDLNEKLRFWLIKHPEEYRVLSKIYEQNTVKIIIPENWAELFGISITRANIREFNRIVELKLKAKLHQYMKFKCSTGCSVASGIRDFQNEFCMPEVAWSFESIKKELARKAELKLRDRILLTRLCIFILLFFIDSYLIWSNLN